jgi:hypothetical protein
MGTRGMSPCERLQTPKELLQSPVRRFDSARRLFVSVQVGSTHHAFTVFRAPGQIPRIYRGSSRTNGVLLGLRRTPGQPDHIVEVAGDRLAALCSGVLIAQSSNGQARRASEDRSVRCRPWAGLWRSVPAHQQSLQQDPHPLVLWEWREG